MFNYYLNEKKMQEREKKEKLTEHLQLLESKRRSKPLLFIVFYYNRENEQISQ